MLRSSAAAGACNVSIFRYCPNLETGCAWSRSVIRTRTTAPPPRRISAPVFDSLRALLQAKPMAAALVATPPSSHHAVSCLLSEHGVHHLVETPMCDTLQQARDMVAQAERQGVRLRIAEQFWRDPD